jgi:D-3-phosphoglycerate dehydrogenase
MRPGALLLNLCRGFVIDHEALRAHLLAGHLAGAAVDVSLDEPRSAGEEFRSVLRSLPNVILTPHIGGSTEEAQADIGFFVGSKLADFIREGTTSLSVNLPGVALPPPAGTCTTTSLACSQRSTRSSPIIRRTSKPSSSAHAVILDTR